LFSALLHFGGQRANSGSSFHAQSRGELRANRALAVRGFGDRDLETVKVREELIELCVARAEAKALADG
jgi:hypothetical protein